MKKHFRLLFLFTTFLTLFVTGTLAQNRIDYSGTYAVQGKNPNGSTYGGSMSVSQYGDGYRVSATYGGETWQGIGTDIGDSLAVAFIQGEPVIVVYRISENNTLKGYWQSYSSQTEGGEILTLASRRANLVPSALLPESRNDYVGRYAVTGKNPDGSGYRGEMTVTRYGDGYHVVFLSGSSRWLGVATDIGDALAIAYQAGDAPIISIFELQSDGSLRGFWSDYNTQREGQEIAIPR